MPRKRATYTAEFKLQAVRMITEQNLSVAEVARRLDVGENLLRLWKKAFVERGTDAFPGHGSPTPADDELRRRRRIAAETKRFEQMDVTGGDHLYIARQPLADRPMLDRV